MPAALGGWAKANVMGVASHGRANRSKIIRPCRLLSILPNLDAYPQRFFLIQCRRRLGTHPSRRCLQPARCLRTHRSRWARSKARTGHAPRRVGSSIQRRSLAASIVFYGHLPCVFGCIAAAAIISVANLIPSGINYANNRLAQAAVIPALNRVSVLAKDFHLVRG